MTVRLLVGDVRDRIREIPDGSIDLLCCSPPFLALRKYGDNDAEMGSERTPADFLDALLELTDQFRRVLAPYGSIAIELGDTYSGSGGGGGDYLPGGLREGQPGFAGSAQTQREGNAQHWRDKNECRDRWPLAKSLTLIPTLYPASLAYGWNMLNPDHQFPRWRVRNVIVWARPNPPVGALGDKVRPATSYITIACLSSKRYFDLDGVRTEAQQPEPAGDRSDRRSRVALAADGLGDPGHHGSHPAGAPPLDWWEDNDPTGHATLILPTQPYPGAHYATWPEKLAARLINMMCPTRVCLTCGEPSRRISNGTEYIDAKGRLHEPQKWNSGIASGNGAHTLKPDGRYSAIRLEGGWSDCGHNTWRPGHVLDPFAGSGTTLAVAQGLGRDATGIELYEENSHLCRERIGMFLEVDEGPAVAAVGGNTTAPRGNPRFRAGYLKNDGRVTPQAKDYGA